MKKIILIFFIFIPTITFGANSTTIGELTLYQTFERIAYSCAFTGDDNANMTAVVEYKPTIGSDWVMVTSGSTSPSTYIDRRTTVADGSGTSVNPLEKTIRGSVLFLDRATSYDVRVTFTDPDGVSGTNPMSETLITWNHDQPTMNGSTYYLDDAGDNGNGGSSCVDAWATVADALTQMSAGDTLKVCPGTYTEVLDITANGASDNYIKITASDTDNIPVFTGEDCDLDAEYVWLDNLQFTNRLTITGPVTNSLITNCTLINEGISLNSGSTVGLLIENNSISLGTADTLPQYDTGVYIKSAVNDPSRVVIRNNTITGGRDGIGGEANNALDAGFRISDIYNNTITSVSDDHIEAEGGNDNNAIWNNILKDVCIDCSLSAGNPIAIAPVILGPVYAFNNLMDNCNQIKTGIPSASYVADGPFYFIHNTMTNMVRGVFESNAPGQKNHYWRNNTIHIKAREEFIDVTEHTGWSLDYNNYDPANATKWDWGTSSYNSFVNWKSGSGQDSHGMSVVAQLVNFVPDAESDLINAGEVTIITEGYAGNIRGTSSDIGAYEYSGNILPDTVPPSAPTGLSIN